jgi:hypothetical protein
MTDATRRWKKRVARWRASGETAEAFSAREGFAANTLRWWSSRLGGVKAAPASVEMVQLVRVPSAAAASSRPASGAVVVELLDARARITVEAGVDVVTLRTVLAAFGIRGAS